MADSFLLRGSSRRLPRRPRLVFFGVPASLALFSSLCILIYLSSTSSVFFIYRHNQRVLRLETPTRSSSIHQSVAVSGFFESIPETSSRTSNGRNVWTLGQRANSTSFGSEGSRTKKSVFHDREIFLEDYKEMNRSFKVFIYPHNRTDPFANVLLPVDSEPQGNYASESYFKKVLFGSHFVTLNPDEADLFFLPFSIARLRHDPRIGVGGIQDFVRDYVVNIRRNYPYRNRTGGADHFYVNCHSVGRSAMDKAEFVSVNSIQVVCSSSYFVPSYFAHKDVPLPQIWPRHGSPKNLATSQRSKTAFFAGAMNSGVRHKLYQAWRNDSEINVHYGRLKTPYTDELLRSKFCLHAKGFEVNTARLADSLFFGCIPVILANYYELPFQDVLDWRSFSVIVVTQDISKLKRILKGISAVEYTTMKRNVLKVRKHFRWHPRPVDFDAFHMVMYQLWVRRLTLRIL